MFGRPSVQPGPQFPVLRFAFELPLHATAVGRIPRLFADLLFLDMESLWEVLDITNNKKESC